MSRHLALLEAEIRRKNKRNHELRLMLDAHRKEVERLKAFEIHVARYESLVSAHKLLSKLSNCPDNKKLLDQIKQNVGRFPKRMKKLKLQESRLQNQVSKLEPRIERMKQLLKLMEIPKLRETELNFTFNTTIEIPQQLFDRVKNCQFYEKEIEEANEKFSRIQSEIEDITPKFIGSRTSNLSTESLHPIDVCQYHFTIGDIISAKAIQSCKPVMSNFMDLPNRWTVEAPQYPQIETLIKKCESASQIKYPTALTNDYELTKIKERRNYLRHIRNEISTAKDEYNELTQFSEDVYRCSPEGLLKWYNQLLQRRGENQDIIQQIIDNRNRTRSRTVVLKRRLNALQKVHK